MKLDGPANRLLKLVGKPPFVYGTAWKKGETARLVKEALESGFKAVDTAAQPKHYQEDLVGEALRQTFSSGILKREDIYLQTKFTSPSGQDWRNMPYDPNADLAAQIHTSVASSLRNLRPWDDADPKTDSYIDCLLMHSPLPTTAETLQAWYLLETYVPDRIRTLGISNVSLPVLQAVYDNAKVKPSVVQNRFYGSTKYDVPLRAFCRAKGIVYESFWTLTVNPTLVKSEPVMDLAKVAGVSKEVGFYSLVMSLDIAVLNGTTSKARMKEDLEGAQQVKHWADANSDGWNHLLKGFKALIES